MKRFFVEWVENIRIAVEQIRTHLTRSILTALGVIIGILAVTMMGTAIQGIDKGFDNSLDMIGRDIIYVEKWPWRDIGDDWVLFRNRPNIEIRYAKELNEMIRAQPDSRLIRAVGSAATMRSVHAGDRTIPGNFIHGTGYEFSLMNTADMLDGRFFTFAEDLSGSNVAILGYDVADTLFPEGPESAIGGTVRIEGHKFDVIGVLDRQGDFLGMQSFDKQVIMPYLALRKFYSHSWRNSIRVQVQPWTTMSAAVDELTGHMRRIRGLLPGEENDFEVNRSEALEEQFGPVKSGIALAGFFITGLALFVGAIGIMNITFVSVKERTREIGTRRALGARRSTILSQFLIESVSICLLGGIIGLLFAFGAQQFVANAFPTFPFTFSGQLVALAFVLSILTGILSGIVPAWQAAGLDPANALRHE